MPDAADIAFDQNFGIGESSGSPVPGSPWLSAASSLLGDALSGGASSSAYSGPINMNTSGWNVGSGSAGGGGLSSGDVPGWFWAGLALLGVVIVAKTLKGR